MMEPVVKDPPSKSDEATSQKEDEGTVEVEVPPASPAQVPKKPKKDDRSKKEDKNVEHFMKSLNSLQTLEEKLAFVCKKYVQTAEENKKLQFYVKQSDKHQAQLLKEKEHLQHEYNVTVLVKSKLENLCRELQKQNKAVKEESLLKIREEDERRKATQAKFQTTISEITVLLQQNSDRNAKLRDDNISMTEKFNSVVQQYQLREQQVEKMAKQMALESQLSDAKLQKASLEYQAEKEKILAEGEHLKLLLTQYRAKITELQGTEKALKSQLAVYTDKYDEFQNALVKSNKVFGGFKDQMDVMSKKIKKLEKESLSWKQRWETSQTALLEMCAERQATEAQTAATSRQLQHMQSLCRTLQAERAALLNALKENNIERPPIAMTVVPPPPPPAAPASNAKMDAMAANCAQLRQSLAHLQTQLNVLTTNKTCPTEESSKPEKQKKGKSKKNKAGTPSSESESVKTDAEAKEATVSSDPKNENKAPEEGKQDDKIQIYENVDVDGEKSVLDTVDDEKCAQSVEDSAKTPENGIAELTKHDSLAENGIAELTKHDSLGEHGIAELTKHDSLGENGIAELTKHDSLGEHGIAELTKHDSLGEINAAEKIIEAMDDDGHYTNIIDSKINGVLADTPMES